MSDFTSYGVARVVPTRAAGLAPGRATDDMVARLRQRIFQDNEVTPEQLFIGDLELSSSRVDWYGTWFGETSHARFMTQIGMGTGRPLNRQHYREYALGKMFEGVVEDLDEKDPWLVEQRALKIPLAKYRFERGGREVASVMRFVIERGYVVPAPSPFATDDIIRGIENTTIEEASIGASVHPIMSPGADLECDICGLSMLWAKDEGCEHIPRVMYTIDDEPVMATGHYSLAGIRHGALVDEGATPGAGTRSAPSFLVEKAQRLLADRSLPKHDAVLLEEVYGVHLTEPRLFNYGTVVMPGGKRPEAEKPGPSHGRTSTGGVTMADPIEQVRSFLMGIDANLPAALEAQASDDPWEATARLLGSELTKARKDAATTERRLGEFKSYVAKQLGGEGTEDLADLITEQHAAVEAGRAFRASKVDEYAALFVSVHGKEHDPEKVRGRVARATLGELDEEIRLLGDLKAKVFTPGRTAMPPVENRVEDEDARKKRTSGDVTDRRVDVRSSRA